MLLQEIDLSWAYQDCTCTLLFHNKIDTEKKLGNSIELIDRSELNV